MNAPHLYYVPELVQWAQENQTYHPEAGWIPARPLGYQGPAFVRRLKLAWAVFTGQYDAVYWRPLLRDLPPLPEPSEADAAAAIAVTSALAATGLEGVGVAPFMYYTERQIDEHNKEQS